LAQSIYSYQSIHDWESVIQEVFDEKTELLKLEKSYRTTYEIMASANLVSKWFGLGV
jgi:DNA helicase IV